MSKEITMQAKHTMSASLGLMWRAQCQGLGKT